MRLGIAAALQGLQMLLKSAQCFRVPGSAEGNLEKLISQTIDDMGLGNLIN